MNVVREIERINKAELSRGGQGGSWHDQYKDSAYIFIGGLDSQLTEGDVITIFSQFGEPIDINLPRDKQTGKCRGFGFLMYEDQRSTVLAVDNLNGAQVLGRTLRVDHVSKYKHLEKGEDGKTKEAEAERMNARPELFMNDVASDSDASMDEADLYDGIDPDDPMAAYLISQRKEERQLAIANGTYKKSRSKSKRDGETKEERQARRAEKRRRKEEKEYKRSRARPDDERRATEEQRRPSRTRSRSPPPPTRRTYDEDRYNDRRRSRTPEDDPRRHRSRSRSPYRSRGR